MRIVQAPVARLGRGSIFLTKTLAGISRAIPDHIGNTSEMLNFAKQSQHQYWKEAAVEFKVRLSDQKDGIEVLEVNVQPEHVHLVIVDNGRSRILGSKYWSMLRCIRCGACLSVCPVFRHIGVQNIARMAHCDSPRQDRVHIHAVISHAHMRDHLKPRQTIQHVSCQRTGESPDHVIRSALAEALDLPVGTVKNRLFRAREARTGRTLELSELSDGTRAQLLLAARLAFVETAEGAARPPLRPSDRSASTGSPASRRPTKLTPLTTRPSRTSRHGMMRFLSVMRSPVGRLPRRSP